MIGWLINDINITPMMDMITTALIIEIYLCKIMMKLTTDVENHPVVGNVSQYVFLSLPQVLDCNNDDADTQAADHTRLEHVETTEMTKMTRVSHSIVTSCSLRCHARPQQPSLDIGNDFDVWRQPNRSSCDVDQQF